MDERCPWCEKDELYRNYHDQEWGLPVLDDRKQFEFLVLESAQAGLSWYTILQRREQYRSAYAQFDPIRVAAYDRDQIEQLMSNPNIIRNRKKVEASINNARRFLEVQQEYGSFCRYIWHFVDDQPIINKPTNLAEVPAKTSLSEDIAKDMKKKGFTFLGPVIVYSHLQATGLINDHLIGCFRHVQVQNGYHEIKERLRLGN